MKETQMITAGELTKLMLTFTYYNNMTMFFYRNCEGFTESSEISRQSYRLSGDKGFQGTIVHADNQSSIGVALCVLITDICGS